MINLSLIPSNSPQILPIHLHDIDDYLTMHNPCQSACSTRNSVVYIMLGCSCVFENPSKHYHIYSAALRGCRDDYSDIFNVPIGCHAILHDAGDD